MNKSLIQLEKIESKLKESNEFVRRSCVRGQYDYYHYGCDGFSDVGWGCGYRTTQTLCSWIRGQLLNEGTKGQVSPVPSILDIQKILVDCNDKPASFLGSKEWIGCFEASIVIDVLYSVPCKLIHCAPDTLNGNMSAIYDHFERFSSPVMMGGDADAASKGVLGIDECSDTTWRLLIADPHEKRPAFVDLQSLIDSQMITWRSVDSFDSNSFYNFCLPQLKVSTQ